MVLAVIGSGMAQAQSAACEAPGTLLATDANDDNLGGANADPSYDVRSLSVYELTTGVCRTMPAPACAASSCDMRSCSALATRSMLRGSR